MYKWDLTYYDNLLLVDKLSRVFLVENVSKFKEEGLCGLPRSGLGSCPRLIHRELVISTKGVRTHKNQNINIFPQIHLKSF